MTTTAPRAVALSAASFDRRIDHVCAAGESCRQTSLLWADPCDPALRPAVVSRDECGNDASEEGGLILTEHDAGEVRSFGAACRAADIREVGLRMRGGGKGNGRQRGRRGRDDDERCGSGDPVECAVGHDCTGNVELESPDHADLEGLCPCRLRRGVPGRRCHRVLGAAAAGCRKSSEPDERESYPHGIR
jgi:hypothetical protein